jgi:hypothetical protein
MTRLPVLNVCRTGGTTCGDFLDADERAEAGTA